MYLSIKIIVLYHKAWQIVGFDIQYFSDYHNLFFIRLLIK